MITKKKKMNYLATKPKGRNRLTMLIYKSQERLGQLKKNNAPIEEIQEEKEWLNRLLDKEKKSLANV